ncbi:MAG TPA: hypothetical protein VF086_10665 [Propionibacteriaceae bacterium]
MTDKTQAIGLTWYISKRRRRLSRKDVELSLAPNLPALQASKKIAAVLPFNHKPLKESGNLWSDYWVIVLALEVSPDEVWQEIKSSVIVSGLLRAEVLRVQPGMDMYYPHGVAKNQPVWHVVEYVVSKPERRSNYYEDQYKFSQPVIRHFWENNAVERMIGFESERLLEDKGSLPKWDVIHITGFKPSRLITIAWHLLRFLPTFNGYARKVGYGSALEVVHSWRKKRTKYLVIARQDHAYTAWRSTGGRKQ